MLLLFSNLYNGLKLLNTLINTDFFLWHTKSSQLLSWHDLTLLSNTLTFGDVVLGNINFSEFCRFRSVTHYVTINICINCSRFYIYTSVIKQNQPATEWCHPATGVDDSDRCSTSTATQFHVYVTIINTCSDYSWWVNRCWCGCTKSEHKETCFNALQQK